MPKDVIITPASGLLDFQGNTGISSATIQLDNNGNLNISNPGGDLTLGDTSRDIFIGDGINSVDIIYEQSGDIRALTGKTLSIGQTDSYVRIAGQLLGEIDVIEGPLLIGTGTSTRTANQRLQVTGGVYINDNTGIGTTNPTSRLHVAGSALVTGITTLGTLSIASGIVTASSGIITYYGDGSKLSKIVGSTISSTAPSSPSAGTLWFNSELGRTFVYYDENLVGAGGTDRYWIDAAPFNVGIITSLSNVSFLTNISFGSGSASAPSWYFDNSVTTGVFSPAAGRINFVSVGSTILSINPSGLSVTGVVTATDFNSTSDIKLKENIHSIDNPLEKVMQINGVGFRWKDSKEPSMGVIAQDIEEIFPELVHQSDQVKTVNYNGLIGVLIEAVKEQQRQIEELKALINKNK